MHENDPFAETFEDAHSEPAKRSGKPVPWITMLLGGIILVVSVGYMANGGGDWLALNQWGAWSTVDIWRGKLWALLTNSFLHQDVILMGMSLLFLGVMGMKIEKEEKWWLYLLLVVSSAVVSSLVQMSFSIHTGLGFGGVCNGLVGFAFIRFITRDDRYKVKLVPICMGVTLLWLVSSVFLTTSEIWQTGYFAGLGGLLWGLWLGFLAVKMPDWGKVVGGAIVFGVTLVPLFWAPWNVQWLGIRAYDLHLDQEYEEAKDWYDKILAIDPQDEFALENLRILKVTELGDSAYKAHSEYKIGKALGFYDQILELEPENTWALQQKTMIEYYDSVNVELFPNGFPSTEAAK